MLSCGTFVLLDSGCCDCQVDFAQICVETSKEVLLMLSGCPTFPRPKSIEPSGHELLAWAKAAIEAETQQRNTVSAAVVRGKSVLCKQPLRMPSNKILTCCGWNLSAPC